MSDAATKLFEQLIEEEISLNRAKYEEVKNAGAVDEKMMLQSYFAGLLRALMLYKSASALSSAG